MNIPPAILQMALNSLGPGSVKQIADLLTTEILNYKKEFKPVNNETEIAALLYDRKGVVFISVIGIAENTEPGEPPATISRQIETKPLADLINTIINKIKKGNPDA